MSILGIINFVFCQWFFFRLTRVWQHNDKKKLEWWAITYWIIPLTGWKRSHYKTVGQLKQINLTEPRQKTIVLEKIEKPVNKCWNCGESDCDGIECIPF